MASKETRSQSPQGRQGGAQAGPRRKPATHHAAAAQARARRSASPRGCQAVPAEAPPAREGSLRAPPGKPPSRRGTPVKAARKPHAAASCRAAATTATGHAAAAAPRSERDDGEAGEPGKPAGRSAQRQALRRQARRAVHGQGAARALPADPDQLEAGPDAGSRPHRHAHEGRGGQFPRPERSRDAGRGIQPRAAHPRSRAQADPQDRRGAEARSRTAATATAWKPARRSASSAWRRGRWPR